MQAELKTQKERAILCFIVPSSPIVELGNGCVKLQYFHHESSKILIFRKEINVYQNVSTIMSILSIQNGDLIMNSCTEETKHGEIITYYYGYPYIRLPEANRPAIWDYQFCENIHMYCKSQFSIYELNGLERDALLVERKVVYRDEQISQFYISTECYVAEYGIVYEAMADLVTIE